MRCISLLPFSRMYISLTYPPVPLLISTWPPTSSSLPPASNNPLSPVSVQLSTGTRTTYHRPPLKEKWLSSCGSH